MKSRHTFFLLASCSLLLASTPNPTKADEPIPQNVQTAVNRGLVWLAKQQDSRGAFSAGGGSAVGAATGLAAMAFMAGGHVPGQGPFGDNLNRAIDYLISIQQNDGTLSPPNGNAVMYEHGICTVALCEAYGMLDPKRQSAAHAAISKAVRLILKAQSVAKPHQHNGGWRYQASASDSDLSVTGWQLMALRGAANIGANVPPAAIEKGIAYVKRCAASSGGFGYTAGGSRANSALTGTGILALELLGEHNAKEALAGGDFLIKQKRVETTFYYYTVYYVSQAAWQLGGRYWDTINPPIRDSLIRKQRGDGAWQAAGTTEQQGGDVYGTSMAILSLTVPYRYLPLYQR
jgi:prenyltransferase beta subunit